MDIERLKELREEVFEDYKAYMVKNLKDEDGKVYPSTVPLDECSPIGKDLLKLIDQAITRQSVKSEEVRIALTWFEELDKHEIVQRIKICPDYTCTMPDNVVLTIITALQAYQPTARKDRTVEEVAISKTETTSCEWCEIASECEYEVTFFEDGDRWAKHRELMPHYCPNCGRKLRENEDD